MLVFLVFHYIKKSSYNNRLFFLRKPLFNAVSIFRRRKNDREVDPDAAFARYQYAWPTRLSVEETASLLSEYGFHDVTTVKETQTAVYQDCEAFWKMLLS
jgi:hypothetical protein